VPPVNYPTPTPTPTIPWWYLVNLNYLLK
jgi:hypothetical protein